MLKKHHYAPNAASLLADKPETQSPYRNLQESPSIRYTKSSLIVDQFRDAVVPTQNHDFSKRLQEIKRKYTSPSKPTRPRTNSITLTDLSHPNTSLVMDQNYTRGRERTPGRHINKSIPDIPKPVSYMQSRQPLQTLNSSYQYPRSFIPVTCGLNADKNLSEDERIGAIDKINDKIKSILDGMNVTNRNQSGRPRVTPYQQQMLKKNEPSLSARPQEFGDTSKRTGNVYSVQREIRSISTNRLPPPEPVTQRDRNTLTQEFDNRIQVIQQRMKKQQENRLSMTQTFKSSPDRKPIKTPVRPEVVNSVKDDVKCQPFKYMEFGKHVSRNIMEELKSFEKNPKETYETQVITSGKQETRRLIGFLVEQVKLDQELRNSKIWLESLADSSKWSRLREILSRKGSKNYSQQEVKSILKCTQDDHNPFYVSQPNQSLDNVVLKYCKADQHWRSKIQNRFEVKTLNEQGFRSEVLDLELKGHLQIQDIVRYLNIQTGKFYRNRDLVLIFKRLSNKSRISFHQLINVLSSK